MSERRTRSELRRADCLKALETFARKVERMVDTSDGRSFSGPNVSNGMCNPGYINVSFLVRGGFGSADDLHEAIRILAGHKIAADDKHPRRKPTAK